MSALSFLNECIQTAVKAAIGVVLINLGVALFVLLYLLVATLLSN